MDKEKKIRNKYKIHFQSCTSQTFHLSQIHEKPKSRTKQKPTQVQRSSASDAGTAETWAPLSQSTVLSVNSSLQKPKKPLLSSTTHPSQAAAAEGIHCDLCLELRGNSKLLQKSKWVEISCGHLGGHYLPAQSSAGLALPGCCRPVCSSACVFKQKG